jgi:hypothetical protein
MTDGIFHGVPLRIRIIFLGMCMSAIAVPILLIMAFVRPEPIERSYVFGCYTSSHAPSLDVREDAIHIIEPARRVLEYVAEPSKTSYQLRVRPALKLAHQPNGRYAFVQTQGYGFFWPLLPVEGQNRNRVRHPNEYAGRFEVATDSERIVYTRQSLNGSCQ